MFELTKVTTSELPSLAAFARSTYRSAYASDLEARELESHLALKMSDSCFAEMLQLDAFYVARDQSQILGYAQVGLVNSHYAGFLSSGDFVPNAQELRRLYVLAAAQSGGIGTQLLEHALAQGPGPASATVYLTTWQDNIGAQRFYERHGFARVGRIPEFDAHGELRGHEYIYARRG